MTRYSGLQIKAACGQAGFSQRETVNVDGRYYSPADIMAAIALGESGGDTQATANTSREYSVGVYQINLKAHPDITEADGRDLKASSAYVYRLSASGSNFQPWTIYKNGDYKHHLPLPGATAGASAPASPVADPNDPHNPDAPASGRPQDVSGGVQQAATILGIVPPTPAEWKQAGLLLFAAMTGIFLVVVGVGAWVKEPVATVVKAVA